MTIVKPWDPPDERLYPPLDELLYDWEADVSSALAPSVRIVGHRFSDRAYALRDFLTRNLVPAAYLDVDADPDAGRLLRAVDGDVGRLPVVAFADGSALHDPELPEVARRVGIHTQAKGEFYALCRRRHNTY